MVRVFIRHMVSDYDAWRAVYDTNGAELRPKWDVIDHVVYQEVDNSNDVTVTHDFETLESARAFLNFLSDNDIMRESGAISEPLIWFVNPT